MKKFEDILDKVAARTGVPAEEVLREIQLAIDQAYHHHDDEAQPLWDVMTLNGDKPTPEEFIIQLALILNGRNGMK